MSGATPDNETGDSSDELRDEYAFDYAKAKPNRFATKMVKDRVVVTLDPDVSNVFTTQDSVNKALRALIEAMPSDATQS